MKTKKYLDLDCVELYNESVTLLVTKSVGPRIISLHFNGRGNLFAELPDTTLECPGQGDFHLWGGHRLWYAPEEPGITYLPDDNPVSIESIPGGLRVTQPVESKTGIEKSMRISIHENHPIIEVEHMLINHGTNSIELAPWAITQMKSGGIAILPQATNPVDEHGVLPNRNIALWPYTQIDSPFISWGNRFIFIHTDPQMAIMKIGFPNPTGWIGYVIDNTLFVKYADFQPEGTYYDLGSSSECYSNQQFLELETLGPRQTLAPGEGVTHTETWKLYALPNFLPTENHVSRLIERLGL